jgi:multidrug resistance efflux pump
LTTETSVSAPPRARPRIRLRPFVIGIGILIVLAVGANFGYNYWRDSTLYVTTDDALVDSNMVPVAASGTGTLVVWRLKPGDKVRTGQVIGVIRPAPSAAAPASINVQAPVDGTVLRVDGEEGQFVGAAQPLAYVADLDHLTITAYIDETTIHKIQPGQQVDVTVDASGSTIYQGTVKEILPATASQFALLQTIDRTTANFTKVTQRVEVHIDLGSTTNNRLYPGESAYVRIHIYL